MEKELKQVNRVIKSQQRIIRNWLHRIKDPTVREICRKRFVEGMSWAGVARVMNMDVAATKMRYYRYRDKHKNK